MKTVGIITVHHYGNYGSALQAYASQKVFEKLGYDTYIIDYRSPNLYYATDKYMDYNCKDDSFYRNLEKKKKGLLKWVIKRISSEPHISQFLYRYLGITRGVDLPALWLKNLRMTRRYDSLQDLFANPPHFDIYVVGGDQLWNPHITYNNPAYFLTFADKSAKRISFSTSIGIPTIPESALSAFKKGLSNLSAILLREEEGVDYLRTLGYDAHRVLDPTLMLTKKEWTTMRNTAYHIPFSQYILAYFLDPSDWTLKLLKTVQRQTGLPVIIIGGKRKNNSRSVFYTGNIEVATFLTLFSNANIVVTNSFHGMAFTLIFEKILISTYRGDESEDSMNSRHRNIINMFGLSSCLYTKENFHPEMLSYEMDYNRINTLLLKYRELSIELLHSAID